MPAYFNAISPLNGGNIDDWYNDRAYPIDLNGGQDYMRPQTGMSPFPYPLMVGAVSGFLSQFNALTLSEMVAKVPYGPWMGDPQGSLSMEFPDITGGLAKVSG